MIISDLNYVEVVTETEVKGGGDVVQAISTAQFSNASVGGDGNARNNLLNVAASLPINLNTLAAITAL